MDKHHKTWYGIDATVDVESRFFHKVGLWKVILPHPALVNLLLRFSLPQGGRPLALKHEFGHLQTAPGALLYLAVVLSLAGPKDLQCGKALFLLVSTQATWEIVSEGYAIFTDPRGYSKTYEGVSLLPRLLFWGIMGVLTAMGWAMIIYTI